MIVKIEKGMACGTVTAPPSKSMAHRLLICGALSEESTISGVQKSEDIAATLSCLKSLGANMTGENGRITLGGLNFEALRSTELFCRESGSTLRFLIPLCLLSGKQMILHGTERLMKRSLSVYEDLCKDAGMTFCLGEKSVTVQGKLTPGKYTVKGNVSSQFISGLMFALPLLSADSEIEVVGGIESEPYLNMTIKALADFGVRISREDENTFLIPGGQSYKKRNLTVEGDYSNAAFLEALNTFGGTVTVEGLSAKTTQGDAVYRQMFEALKKGTPTLEVSGCPDLAPVLMAVAAAHHGAILTGTRRLKIKESDRGEVMCDELAKFGISAINGENRILVRQGKLSEPRLPLYGHNDHRIVMALSVLLTLTGGEIYGAEAVAKSFPNFFEVLEETGISVKRC